MKIIIDNKEFNYDIGCKLLKLKHTTCPFSELEDIWKDIVPLSFKEIIQFKNIEDRRIGFLYLGLERLIKEVNPKLVDSQTLNKTTTWVNQNNELETINYEDTYKLFKVDSKYLNNRDNNKWYEHIDDCYFIEFKDTSTDRDYLLWVDYNNLSGRRDAIDAIAWTIQTNIAVGNIEKIVRQGDCILIKAKPDCSKLSTARHLTREEYLNLLVLES